VNAENDVIRYVRITYADRYLYTNRY
jgi:hypothetical protein